MEDLMKLHLLILLSLGLYAKESTLMQAVKGRDMMKIKQLIQQKVNIDGDRQWSLHEAWGETALMIASKHADLDIMRLLIEYGADVNAVVFQDFPKSGHPVLIYRELEQFAQELPEN